MPQNLVLFRPHHFLCTLGFQGVGYSSGFVNNFKDVIHTIQSGKSICVTLQLDTLCKPCPHHNGTVCHTQAFISTLDQKHAKALELREGDILTWRDALERIKERIALETFHIICEGCSWKETGMCEEALRRLHTKQKKS